MNRVAHAEARQVKDDVDAGEGVRHRGAIPNVRDDKAAALLNIVPRTVQILTPAVDEVVDDDDVGPTLDELADQFGPDEAGAAGDEDTKVGHKRVPSLKSEG